MPTTMFAADTDLQPFLQVSEEEPVNKRLLLIPYPFYNDSIGAGIGVAAIAEGYLQSQTITVASGLVSANGTGMFFLMDRKHRLPWMERLFVEPPLSVGKFEDIQIYAKGNPNYPNERPGSNDSNKDNYFESEGTDN